MPTINSANISFNDAIYRETGINLNSVAMRDVELLNCDGIKYSLQVIKKNVNNKETFYFALKDAFGRHIQDVSIKFSGKVYKLDSARSQDSVVIDLPGKDREIEMELISDSASISTNVNIELEKPRETNSEPKKQKEKDIIKESKRKKEAK